MRQRKNRFLLDEIDLSLDSYVKESNPLTCYRRGGGGGSSVDERTFVCVYSGYLGHEFEINSKGVLLDILRNSEAIFKKHVVIEKSIFSDDYGDGLLDTLFHITLSENISPEEKLRALLSSLGEDSLTDGTIIFKTNGYPKYATYEDIKDDCTLWNSFVSSDTRTFKYRYPIPIKDKNVYRYPTVQVIPLVQICNYWWELEKAGKAALIDICRLAVKMFFIEEKSPAAVYEYGEYKNLPEVNLPSYDELLRRYE